MLDFFSPLTTVQVVVHFNAAEPKQTEPLHSPSGQDPGDLKTDDARLQQSPRSSPRTEKVMLLK